MKNSLLQNTIQDGLFVVAKYWTVKDFLGSGSFGETYKGVILSDVIRSSSKGSKLPEEVAIKFERLTSNCPQLEIEYKILNALHDNGQNVKGIPKAYSLTIEGDYKCLVMTLLGPSIYNLYEQRNVPRWTYCTVAAIGLQMLNRIEYIHARGYIHRDVKPDNFLTGREGDTTIYAIDFGLAKRFRTSGNAHIPLRQGKQLTGTARYASVNAHKGYEQSRRDDLEGMVYCLIFLTSGKLPWQGLRPPQNASQKYKHIQLVKEKTSMVDVCKPSHSPELLHLLSEARSYSYNQRPRYALMRNILTHGIIARQYMLRSLHPITREGDTIKIPNMDWNQTDSIINEILKLESEFYKGFPPDLLKYDRTFYASKYPTLSGHALETRDVSAYQHLSYVMSGRSHRNSMGVSMRVDGYGSKGTDSYKHGGVHMSPAVPSSVHLVKANGGHSERDSNNNARMMQVYTQEMNAGYLSTFRSKTRMDDVTRDQRENALKWGQGQKRYNQTSTLLKTQGFDRKAVGTTRTQRYDLHEYTLPTLNSKNRYLD